MIQEVVYITNQKEIPKDYVYDTETHEFWVYRNKYTGEELHLAKIPPLYVDVSKVVLQVLKDVRAELHALWNNEPCVTEHGCDKEVYDLIDRKIAEVKGDKA